MLIYFLFIAEVNVYFNKGVDTTYMDTVAAESVSLYQKLCERISKAQYSIDFCFYDWGRANHRDSVTSIIVDSIISAKNRGVKIRVITDNENMGDSCIQTLIDSGIQVINDRRSSLMHNKFAIFDARDTIAENSWVWTGSYNITDYGEFSNSNDVIEIQDDSLAKAYTLEFNEMWGDTGDISPDTGHFGTSKCSDPAWQFIINGEHWGLYFSPTMASQDSARLSIINAVKTADHSIYFCIYFFTRQPLCDTMKERRDSNEVIVRGVFDAGGWNYHHGYTCSKSYDMRDIPLWYEDSLITNVWTPPAPVYADSVSAPFGYTRLHHKYMIIDAEFPDSDPIVITGSQNWTNAGCHENDENILIIHSYSIANQYLQHFIARYEEAGGTYEEPVAVEEITKSDPESPETSSGSGRNPKLKAYPNPFIRSTVIGFEPSGLTTKYCIYDITGRLINEVNTNVIGEDLAPGIYFLKANGYQPLKLIKLH